MTRSPLNQTLYQWLFWPLPSTPVSDRPSSLTPDSPPQSVPSAMPGSRYTAVWLGLSLAIALVYGVMALQQALSGDYVVQDDARQHVFWMQRFLDPTAFPNDLIADYFQSVAPAGYRAVYRVAAALGLAPVFFHKVLPVGLNMVTAGLCFRAVMGVFPVPFAAFCSSVMLMQGLSLTDAIVSGTPKAFIYPLLLLFIDGVVRQRRWVTWVAIALQGLFYPQLVLISGGVLVLRLVQWSEGRLRLVAGRDRILCLGGLLVAGLVLLPYAVQTSEFGPTLTLEQARQLPELSMSGSRSRFFRDDDPASFWLEGRSGLRPATIFTPVTHFLGVLLLLLPWRPKANRLLALIHPRITLLPQMVLSSLVCFGLAHLLLFRLHLPSRYTQHSLRVVVSMAAGIVVVGIMQGLWQWSMADCRNSDEGRTAQGTNAIASAITVAVTLFLLVAVVGYPLLVAQFPLRTYQYGNYPQLYAFLQQQPSDSLVASLDGEVNNIPTFAQRSILTGSEYAIPYHVSYYRQHRQRTIDLIDAQYSPSKQMLRDFIKTYGVNLWLIDRNAFQPDYVEDDSWIQQHPQAATRALAATLGKRRSAVARSMRACRVFKEKRLILLDAGCLARDR